MYRDYLLVSGACEQMATLFREEGAWGRPVVESRAQRIPRFDFALE